MYIAIIALTLLGYETQVFHAPEPMLYDACMKELVKGLMEINADAKAEFGDQYLIVGKCVPLSKEAPA